MSQEFVSAFMANLAGSGVTLSPTLQSVFANILANQITTNDDGELVFGSSFDTLAQIFTFVATPASDRPESGILGYGEETLEQAKTDTATEQGVELDDGLTNTNDSRTFSIDSDVSSIVEGNAVTFTVTASEASDTDQTLTYQVAGATIAGDENSKADPLTDLGILNGQVTIPAGETTATIELTPSSDGSTEGLEGFLVNLLDSDFAVSASSNTVAIEDPANAGQSFTLTTGVDGDPAFTGGAGDDTYTAVVDDSADENTWTALDNLNGGDGQDTLNINNTAVDGSDDIDLTLGTITNIETINIQSVNDVAAGATVAANGSNALDFSANAGIETVNITKAVDSEVKVSSSQDLNVSGVTGVTYTDGGANVDVEQAIGTDAGVNVQNAANVSIAVTGSDGSSDADKAITVGTDGVIVNGATGTVDITVTGAELSGNDGAAALDTVNVTGGTVVTVTQVAAAGYGNAATTNAGTDDVVTQGDVTVTATTDTTEVTVTQEASRAVYTAVEAVTGVAVTQDITFAAMAAGETVVLDFSGGNTLTFTAKKALTAAEAASAFANISNGDVQVNASASLGLYSDAGTGATADAGSWSSGDVVVVDASSAKVTFTNTNSAVTDIADGSGDVAVVAGTGTTGTDAVTAVTGVTGIVSGAVAINEDGAGNDNITTISLDAYGTGSTIGSATALSTLNLSNSGLTYTANSTTVTAAADLTVTDTAETLALNLENVGYSSSVDAALTLTNAPLTLNVTSTGFNAIDLTAAATTTLNVSGTGTLYAAATDLAALETVTVSGSAGVQLNSGVANTVTSVDASATSGYVAIQINGTTSTYAGSSGTDMVTLDTGTALTKSIDLGAGNDTLSFAALSVSGSTATLSGGEGDDTLSMAVATADALDATSQTFYTNFERLTLNDAAGDDDDTEDTVTIDLETLGFTTYVTSNGTVVDTTTPGNSDILVFDNMASGGTIVLDAAAAGTNTKQTVNIKDASTNASDSLNVITDASDATNLGTLTADNVESVSITANNTLSGSTSTNTLALDADKATDVTLAGNGNLVLTFSAASTEIATVDGSVATAALTVTTNAGDSGATTVTGGSGEDVLTLQGANDVAIGGAGNDTLIVNGGVASAATLTGGEGTDTFQVDGFTAANAGAAVTITDLEANETIKFDPSQDGLNFATGQVTLIDESTYTEYVQEAAAQADAASETLYDAVSADDYEGGIAWFQFGTTSVNTFIVQDVNGDGVFSDGTDIVVKLTGAIDLSNSSFSVTEGTLEYIA